MASKRQSERREKVSRKLVVGERFHRGNRRPLLSAAAAAMALYWSVSCCCSCLLKGKSVMIEEGKKGM